MKHLKRWAASNDTFTLDFGSHEDDYTTVITQQGEEMSQLIAGYIDILLQKQRGNMNNLFQKVLLFLFLTQVIFFISCFCNC